MAAATASTMVDLTKAGKYPVVLSDALLDKTSKETYTGIRCRFAFAAVQPQDLKSKTNPTPYCPDNHKPHLSDSTSLTARLKQTSSKDGGAFALSLDDNGTKYAYDGVRTTRDGNFVLVFDPARHVFVLHRLDSLFHMNIVRMPGNSDPDSLQRQFPPLDVQQPHAQQASPPSSGRTKAAAAPRKTARGSSSALRKPATKKTADTKKKT